MPRVTANCIRFEGFKVVCDWRVYNYDAKQVLYPVPHVASTYMQDVADILSECTTAQEAADELCASNNDGSWHVIDANLCEIPSVCPFG